MNRKHLFLLLLLGVTHSQLFSQCCSGGVPISGTIGLGTNDKHSWNFLITQDYNVLQQLFEGASKLNDNKRKRVTNSTLIETNYGLTNKITLSSIFSFINQKREINTISNLSNTTSTSGIGDAVLLLKYRIKQITLNQSHGLIVGIGPKLPLGKSNIHNDSGIILPADLQPGTGAWDFLIWGLYQKANLFTKNLTGTLAISFRKTGINREYFGSQQYQFGNELMVNLQSNYRFIIKSHMYSGTLALRYRNQHEDYINGENFPNSGGNFVFLNPSLSLYLTPKFLLTTGAYIPVYQNVGGTQLATSYKLLFSLSYTLTNNKNN